MIGQILPYLAGLATIAAMLGTAVHVIQCKQDVRAAAGWLGLVWFAPVLGMLLYWTFGINRIKRRARIIFSDSRPGQPQQPLRAIQPERLPYQLGPGWEGLSRLAGLSERITSQPLVAGNSFLPLVNGDRAYPVMIQAIQKARRSVTLSTYIFGNDVWGKRFTKALGQARARGVSVRVLIDDIGARYSLPSICRTLRREQVPVARFMRSFKPWRFRYYNLRNHRKIMVVDGRTGFTGGMNIQAGNVLADKPEHPIQDLHFRVDGPVVAELQSAFCDDWKFTTGEILTGPKWFPEIKENGKAVARGISDGPDEDYDKLRFVLLGALSCAQDLIFIACPYFLPDRELCAGLKIAAMKGVRVTILLPEKSNLKMVHWATWAGLKELIQAGCSIILTPEPFEHSKVMLVDDMWILLGSANWDPRSLQLNFEYNVEVYDRDLAETVKRVLEEKAFLGRELSLEQIQEQPYLSRLRNQVFRLFSPYL
ncbi:MAG: phospholipase D-like domain-containing protein [Thermodesulfobacteriota bacterium]